MAILYSLQGVQLWQAGSSEGSGGGRKDAPGDQGQAGGNAAVHRSQLRPAADLPVPSQQEGRCRGAPPASPRTADPAVHTECTDDQSHRSVRSK